MQSDDTARSAPHGGTPTGRFVWPSGVATAAVAVALAGCGDDGGPSSPAPVVAECDVVEYGGESFSGFECEGQSVVRRTLTSGSSTVTFVVDCDDDCVRTAFVSEPGMAGAPDDEDEGAPVGSGCDSDDDCASDLVCDEEILDTAPIEGLPDGTTIPLALFPGGTCTPALAGPLGAAGVCNPNEPRMSQGCGRDGVCVPLNVGGQLIAACRQACDPADPEDCGRDNYRCDPTSRACVEGCLTDAECRAQVVDTDGDGFPDGLSYDDESSSVCEASSGRCILPDGDGGETGDACERQDDCEATGSCRTTGQPIAGFPYPDGYCSKIGCDAPGNECAGDDSVCTTVRSWSTGPGISTACMTQCEVGAESEADQTGSDGHGAGCRDGYRCHYSGGPDGARSGVCVGGNYNDVDEPNLGAACASDSECFSPFGLGICVSLSVQSADGAVQGPPTGACAIMDCAVPGLPDDICGDNGTCRVLRDDVAYCAATCQEAADCAPGYACADDDGREDTAKLCFPVCADDDECRKGEETCQTAASGLDTCQPAPTE